ncbi:hypothetical protein GUJ93_ZPchr0003g17238 [Zizania palustris]|uniref:Uncharacterized protein n=1 Tax=Zizania palustris TaxID=103762 RepID=A0A8J5SE55_ZIZPA|nr:hypothetical protein GUJ93_ZPchr0003g17238 [Zizania palustris]
MSGANKASSHYCGWSWMRAPGNRSGRRRHLCVLRPGGAHGVEAPGRHGAGALGWRGAEGAVAGMMGSGRGRCGGARPGRRGGAMAGAARPSRTLSGGWARIGRAPSGGWARPGRCDAGAGTMPGHHAGMEKEDEAISTKKSENCSLLSCLFLGK